MQIRLRDKNQVTLPSALCVALDAGVGDFFEAKLEQGAIILRPQQISPKQGDSPKGPDIQKWIGSGKGLFKSREEVDAFIRTERDRWD